MGATTGIEGNDAICPPPAYELDMTPAAACAKVDAWGPEMQFGLHQVARVLRRALADLRTEHERRVTELLEANNAEVERRRVTQRELASADREIARRRDQPTDETWSEMGTVWYFLNGYRPSDDRLSVSWEIPARLWPLMGSLVGSGWGDGLGEYEITQAAADSLAAAMGGDLKSHPNHHWSISPTAVSPRHWKIEWLQLADRLDRFADRVEPTDRVCQLIVGWARELRGLLLADVNGGLDEEYADYPDPPTRPAPQ